MLKNVQDEENNQQVKERTQQKLDIKNTICTNEKCQQLEKNMNKLVMEAQTQTMIFRFTVDTLHELQERVSTLSKLLKDVSSRLTMIETQNNKKNNNIKKRMVSLTPSDLEANAEDISETDSTRSEDSEINSVDRRMMILEDGGWFSSDKTYYPDEDQEFEEYDEDEFFPAESSVEMLSRSVAEVDL